ncbi:hypothetical protein [Flavobacterium sp. CLA17]|uniref:hypothetical protein n=1 Tax=Flavobacterium sp. CLA17 TaxID=2724135 RepID=UPI0014912CBB|nr:hypothetical protein [Flavobacterium sp. CLA17]QSB24968.1 hypothetical protein HAV12_011315 [Flavobacterium sp. CLA17]
MDKHIIIKDYLESLTEKEELDYLFPMLLESMGFVILSKPTEYIGFPQYGKDIIAVGIDKEDRIKKKFYFELKGGHDKDITTATFNKNDGVKESLVEAKFKKFEAFSFPKFKDLPLKIVLAHNGVIKGNVQELFEGFIQSEFPASGDIEFENWNISKLTHLFSDYLFNEQLLINAESTRLFKKVIINLDSTDTISKEYQQLLDLIFSQFSKNNFSGKKNRKWQVFFESLKLISFIIYTSAKDYNNLEIAKSHITYLVLKSWHWILKNNFEKEKIILIYFRQIIDFYIGKVLHDYFARTLPIATQQDGLYYEKGGRYESIGYTLRTMDYLQYFVFFADATAKNSEELKIFKDLFLSILSNNSVSARPLIDIHSISVISNLKTLIFFEETEKAKDYLREVFNYIIYAKTKYERMPDANNSIKNVIKLILTKEKSIYYSDTTSPLLASLFEFLAILNMEKEYITFRDFVIKNKIDLGLFIPHVKINGRNDLIKNQAADLEQLLFSQSVFEGYQTEIKLPEKFQDFRESLCRNKNEFEYHYRTDAVGYFYLRRLAHIWFKTPLFTDEWRTLDIGT